jgi:type II secretory pathway component GspD/PulD (secretin)
MRFRSILGWLALVGGVLCLQGFPLAAQAQVPGSRGDARRSAQALAAGEKAEAAGHFQEALKDYSRAQQFATPGDDAGKIRAALLRSKLVRQHMDAAEALALGGNISQATQELNAALRVDPGNATVAERLAQMKSMALDELPPAEATSRIVGLPQMRPLPGTRSFDLRGDTRSVYEQVAQAFGITVVFDAELNARSVRLRVHNVDFATAMDVVSKATNTFWRPVNPTLIFVAVNSTEKRRQYAVVAEQTFVLPASVDLLQMTELVRALREIVSATHIDLDSASRSVTIRDTPAKLRLASELIHQLERGPGEVLLDFELLEVDRNAARTLGVLPPAGARLFSLSSQDVKKLGASTDVSNFFTNLLAVFNAQGLSSIPPVVLLGGGRSTFLLNLPSATASFADALSLVQSGREILMRAQNGKPATFFVGTRFPVTLSQLSASLGNTSVPGSVGSTIFRRTDFAVGRNPVAIASRDFNSDSQPDLAVANETDNSISILLNQGNGNFAPSTGSPIQLGANETGPDAIATAVLRNNSVTTNPVFPDLVIANSTSNNVTVLLGNGDGTFKEAPGSPFATGHHPSAALVADFNGDGNLDIAVANQADNSITLLQGDGAGNFKPFPNSPFILPNGEQGPVAMVTAAFRNNGKPDLAVLNQLTNNISILLSSGDSAFTGKFTEALKSPVAVGNKPVSLAAGDLNRDGLPDLAIVNQGDNSISLLLGNGDGTFGAAAGSPLPTAATPAGIVIADFTNDGIPDLAVADQGASTLAIYVGLGGGAFSNRLEISAPANPNALASADFNGDGLPDVAVTSSSGSTNLVSVFLDPSAFTSGIAGQVPYPGSEFVDLGVKVKATPSVTAGDEVTLQLDFEIRSLAGVSVNGIPVITNRTLSQTVRVKEGESTLLAGLLDKEETRSLTGLPGLARIPAADYLFAQRANSNQDTELLILVTPHKLRVPPHTSQTILAGHDAPVPHGGPPAPPEP